MAFVTIHRGSFLSKQGDIEWGVEIQEDREDPTIPGELTFEMDQPLVIEWHDKEVYEPVCASSATLRIDSPDDRSYIDLYSIAPGKIRLVVYKNSDLYWIGTLDPEFYSEPYEKTRHYTVTLTFSDFGILERVNFTGEGNKSLVHIFLDCYEAAKMDGLQGDDDSFFISTNFADGPHLTPYDISVRSDNFYDEEGKPLTLLEVLKSVLQPLALRIVQRAGRLFVYDINAVTYLPPAEIVWRGDSSTLSTGKVYNNVKIKFSPYAKAENLLPEITYKGKINKSLRNLTAADPNDPIYGSYYSFPPDITYMYSGETHVLEDPRVAADFTIFLSQEGKGVAWHGGWPYFHISPGIAGGAPECSGIAFGFVACDGETSYRGYLGSGTPKLQIRYISPTITVDPIFTTERIYIPPLSQEDRENFYLRVVEDVLIDARYNPFASPGKHNEEANDKFLKEHTAWAFIPFGITLYGESGDTWHYTNEAIARSATKFNLQLSEGCWERGNAQCGQAWLEYYNPEDLKKDTGLRGWQSNRQCVGRPDRTERLTQAAIAPNNGIVRDGNSLLDYLESFKKLPAGQYIPYPPEGGFIEIKIFRGLRAFGYAEKCNDIAGNTIEDYFDLCRDWDNKNFWSKLRWGLYKAPTFEIVSSSPPFDAVGLDDIEFSGYINKDAKEDLSIDTICGSLESANPLARGVYTRTGTGRQISLLERGGVIDRPERLLIGSIYSQSAERKTKLSGTVAIDTGGLAVFSEENQEDKIFFKTEDIQDIIEGTATSTFVEISRDNYEAIEPVDDGE